MLPEEPLLTREEDKDLQWAYARLEHPSFAARLSSVIGMPLERTLKLLPPSWCRAIETGAQESIARATEVAVATLGADSATWSGDKRHRVLAAVSGAAGGFAGPLGLLGELPFMTVLMLRSIAAIASRHGEDLQTDEARFACVEVFGLGARSRDDDGAETGYFGIRSTLAFHFGGVLTHGASPSSIPAGAEFIRNVASRFGVAVTDGMAAKIVPVVGAMSGAALNVLFMKHFQDVAKGHFIVRRLERKYGQQPIRLAYDRIARLSDERSKVFSPLEGW